MRNSLTSARAKSTAGPQRSRSNGLSRCEAINTPTLYVFNNDSLAEYIKYQ